MYVENLICGNFLHTGLLCFVCLSVIFLSRDVSAAFEMNEFMPSCSQIKTPKITLSVMNGSFIGLVFLSPKLTSRLSRKLRIIIRIQW